MSPEQWMSQALLLAEKSAALDEVPIGALFVHEQKIIASGFNQRECQKNTLGHAELLAIQEYNQKFSSWRLPKNTTLYVTCEPCLMCTGALLQARVENIFYGCGDTKNAGLECIREKIDKGIFDHRFLEIRSGVLEKECKNLLSNFFAQKRKLPIP
jgi:tRNA(adenine34) deaminase